jgi:hypothetical protein
VSAPGSADAACSPIYPNLVRHYRRMPDIALLAVANNISAPEVGYTSEALILCRELARRFASALASLREAERRLACGCYGTSCSECDAAEAGEAKSGSLAEAIKSIREAGGAEWDSIADPEEFLYGPRDQAQVADTGPKEADHARQA